MVSKFKYAFTLAEVLITLGIIGVVAAMTMPSLIMKHREKEYVVKLKKFNSVMNQAIKMAVSENGEISEWGLSNWTSSNPDDTADEIEEGNRSRNAFWERVLPQLQVADYCRYGDECKNVTRERYSLDGTQFGSFNSAVNLADGTTITGITISNINCQDKYGSGALQNVCGELFVDLNGKKLPNATGKDVFLFFITKYGVTPMGTSEQTSGFTFDNYCNMGKRSNLNGYGCAAWVIYNENMDYTKCNDLSWDGKTKCE